MQILNYELQSHPKVVLERTSLEPLVTECTTHLQIQCPQLCTIAFSLGLLQSRAALSLLGFCHYHLQDYQAAADW